MCHYYKKVIRLFFLIFIATLLGFIFICYYLYSYDKKDKYDKLNALVFSTKTLNISFSNSYNEDDKQLQNKAFLFQVNTDHLDFVYVK